MDQSKFRLVGHP